MIVPLHLDMFTIAMKDLYQKSRILMIRNKQCRKNEKSKNNKYKEISNLVEGMIEEHKKGKD